MKPFYAVQNKSKIISMTCAPKEVQTITSQIFSIVALLTRDNMFPDFIITELRFRLHFYLCHTTFLNMQVSAHAYCEMS